MKLRFVAILAGIVVFGAGWGALRHSSIGAAFAQSVRPAPQFVETPTPPIDPSVPEAEAKLIRDLQGRVAALERRVQELDNGSRPHFTPLTDNSR
jgi:hypothetical protein